MKEHICKQNANKFFWPEYDGKCKPGWCLHHKDPMWKIEDPERYAKWSPEDLVPMENSEHMKWHRKWDRENKYASFKEYAKLLVKLAEKYGEYKASTSMKYIQTKKSCKKAYEAIGLIIYINEMNRPTYLRSINYGHIPSHCFQAISKRLYREILENLRDEKMICINDHYLHGNTRSFTKSYVIHSSLKHINIDENKEYQSYIEKISDVIGKKLGKYSWVVNR